MFSKRTTISSGGAVFAIGALMLVEPILLLSLCVCVVYAVVPVSAWRKNRTARWKTGIIVSLVLFLLLVPAIFVTLMVGPDESLNEAFLFPKFALLISVALAGLAFLPLTVLNSIQSIRISRTLRKPKQSPESKTKA